MAAGAVVAGVSEASEGLVAGGIAGSCAIETEFVRVMTRTAATSQAVDRIRSMATDPAIGIGDRERLVILSLAHRKSCNGPVASYPADRLDVFTGCNVFADSDDSPDWLVILDYADFNDHCGDFAP